MAPRRRAAALERAGLRRAADGRGSPGGHLQSDLLAARAGADWARVRGADRRLGRGRRPRVPALRARARAHAGRRRRGRRRLHARRLVAHAPRRPGPRRVRRVLPAAGPSVDPRAHRGCAAADLDRGGCLPDGAAGRVARAADAGLLHGALAILRAAIVARAPRRTPALLAFVLVAVLGAALAAVHLLPILALAGEFTRRSPRRRIRVADPTNSRRASPGYVGNVTGSISGPRARSRTGDALLRRRGRALPGGYRPRRLAGRRPAPRARLAARRARGRNRRLRARTDRRPRPVSHSDANLRAARAAARGAGRPRGRRAHEGPGRPPRDRGRGADRRARLRYGARDLALGAVDARGQARGARAWGRPAPEPRERDPGRRARARRRQSRSTRAAGAPPRPRDAFRNEPAHPVALRPLRLARGGIRSLRVPVRHRRAPAGGQGAGAVRPSGGHPRAAPALPEAAALAVERASAAAWGPWY